MDKSKSYWGVDENGKKKNSMVVIGLQGSPNSIQSRDSKKTKEDLQMLGRRWGDAGAIGQIYTSSPLPF